MLILFCCLNYTVAVLTFTLTIPCMFIWILTNSSCVGLHLLLLLLLLQLLLLLLLFFFFFLMVSQFTKFFTCRVSRYKR